MDQKNSLVVQKKSKIFRDTRDQRSLCVFQGDEVRRTWFNDEWWFSIIDIIEILTGTERPRKYWSDLKKKLIDEGCLEVSEKIGQLKLIASDGKRY